MKRWLFFLFFIINTACLFSQTGLKQDTGYVRPRAMDNNALKELKSTRDFQYDKSRETPQSLWERFWNWFWWKVRQLLANLLRTRNGRITFWSILIVSAIAIIIFSIMKLTGMDKNGLFGRSSRSAQKYSLLQEDINLISFEDAIEKAINNGNYRLATRLYYLQALKKLSDRGYIDWRINKTDTDYLAEITGKPFKDIFARLTFDFEYTWYGENQLSKEQFLEIRKQFQQFNNQVQ